MNAEDPQYHFEFAEILQDVEGFTQAGVYFRDAGAMWWGRKMYKEAEETFQVSSGALLSARRG